MISRLLPAPKKRGRKAADFRVILNAMFYMIRVGCPWRLSPKDFPPFTTVQNRFYAWRDGGLWPQIIAVLVMAAREAEGRPPAPTAVVVDRQSVRTTEAGGPRGFDSGQENQGPQTTYRRRYDRPADRMLGHRRQRSGSRRPGAAARRRASQESVGDYVLCQRRLSGRRGATVRLRGEPHFHHGRQVHRQAGHGVHRLAEKMGRRVNPGLDQSRATPVQGFRGDNRILARLATIGPCLPPHAKTRDRENRSHLNFESGSQHLPDSIAGPILRAYASTIFASVLRQVQCGLRKNWKNLQKIWRDPRSRGIDRKLVRAPGSTLWRSWV